MPGPRHTRRTFLHAGLASAGAFAVGAGLPRYVFGAPATTIASPYGPLGAYDARGIALPSGFTSRELARAGQLVGSTGYTWHDTSDGQGVFPEIGGSGWYLVANSELGGGAGRCSSLRFNSSGNIIAAQQVCSGTTRNCSGGVTPWGTWLTCEEHNLGEVYEVDPTGVIGQVKYPLLGKFNHEAAAVDPIRERIYLTEDDPNGCLYRFVPDAYPDLTAGSLQVATVAGDNSVTWTNLPDPTFAGATPTRNQIPTATRFNGGEGMWYDDGKVYFTTKGDRKVWVYDAATATMDLLYDLALADPATPMNDVDNTVVSRSGDLFVCEDGGGPSLEMCMITPDRYVSAFLRMNPAVHGSPGSNEVTGVAFDPSGSRMYFSAQRSFGAGALYEVSGPFRVTRPAPPTIKSDPTPTPTPTTTTTTTPPPVVPIAPGLPARDTRKPGVRIRSLASRLTFAALLDRGLSVLMEIDEPVGVDIVLRATGHGVLARSRTTTAVAGRVRLRLRPRSASIKRMLRRRTRPLRAQLTITTTDRSGNKTVTRRTVTLRRPRRRRRR